MCLDCDQVIKEMDIRDLDLPNLPFTYVKQRCAVPMCKNGIILKDYGIAPLYYHPVKVRRYDHKDYGKCWRGGWLDVSVHAHTCSGHHTVDKGIIQVSDRVWFIIYQKITKDPNYLISRVIEHKKKLPARSTILSF